MLTPRYTHAAAPLPDGSPLFVGGLNTPTPLRSAEIYSPTSNTFSATADMGIARTDDAVAKINDGVMVAGGSNGVAVLKTAELYLVAPNGKIDKGPAAKVSTKKPKAKVSFTFSSDLTGSTFQCSLSPLGGKKASAAKKKKKKRAKPITGPCTSPQTYKLRPGRYSFSLTASSPHAIPDATPATQAFKVKLKR
jgi:hypothetical protein